MPRKDQVTVIREMPAAAERGFVVAVPDLYLVVRALAESPSSFGVTPHQNHPLIVPTRITGTSEATPSANHPNTRVIASGPSGPD